MTRDRLLVIGVMLGALAGAKVARAEGDPAADRRTRADQLASDGKFVEAAVAYLDAYAIDHAAELVCNAGIAYLRAKQLALAQLYLAECSVQGETLDAHFRAVVRANLGEIEDALHAGDFTPVKVDVEPATALVSAEDFPAHGAVTSPHVIWMAFGGHVLTVDADGYVERKVPVTAAGKELQPVHVKLDAVALAPVIVVRTVRPPRIGLRWPVAAVAATVAFGGFAAIAGDQASSDAKRAGFALNPKAFDGDRNAVDAWNRAFGLGVGGAIAGALASVYLWRLHLIHVDVEAKPGVAMLSLGGAM